MKLSNFFLFIGLCSLVACSSAPPPAVHLAKPQINISQLDATFCHMQLTDLLNETNAVTSPQSSYHMRMELRQKLNQWVQQDAELSVECQKMAFDIQNQWRKHEESILSQQHREKPTEQRVFTNSQWQLYSNPLLTDASPATSVSDLQNGDVVIADGKLFVIAKNENGDMRSWMPDAPTHWVQLSMQHSMGWLKQPAKRVVALRHWSANKAAQIVHWLESQQKGGQLSQRHPSSLWNFLGAPAELELEANPHFLQVFEWRNYSSLQSTP